MATIAERIQAFNKGRLPEYLALKYQVMAENPFRFLRGTCHLFYEDLHQSNALPPSPVSWICGDLHLENFGTFKGDNRLVYFDLNDFDEGLLAPVNWELARMVTSIFTGFSSLDIPKKEALRVAELYLRVYSKYLAAGRSRYIEPRTATGIVEKFLDTVCERRQKDLIRQRTIPKKDNLALRIDNVRLFPLEKTLKKQLIAHLSQWMQKDEQLQKRFQVLDCAFRVAGTGSLGVRRYVFLVQNKKDLSKHLLIDMKQALPSSLQPYCQVGQPVWTSEAERVVSIQEKMQNVAPALLSTFHFDGDDYVIKEMQPTADKIEFLQIRGRNKDVECVVEDMAVLTASAQLRSSGRQGSAVADELIAFGKDSHWQASLLDYAKDYTEKIKRDYNEYCRAYKEEVL